MDLNCNDKKLFGVQKEIDRVFDLQMDYKWRLKQSTAKDRIEKLKRLRNCILENKEEIQEAIYNDFKKPSEEVFLTEIYPVTSEIKHTIKNLRKWMKDKRVRSPLSHFGSKSKIRYEPRGVSLIMSPWNFPFQLAMDPLVSAIAAGNCVILKPSELSPYTTECIKNIVQKVFEEREVAVFEGEHELAQLLVEKPFDNIFFTGSPSVGKKVMEAASKNLTTVTLELGGKSPVIIDDKVNLDEAAKRIVWGKCLNAGQICVAPDYLLIPEDKQEEFIKLAGRHIKSFYGSIDGVNKDLKYTRIINQRHFIRIKDLIDDAISKGAKLKFGGHYKEDERFISPTLITDVPYDAKILDEEIFGPVLPIITYKHIDEAIEYVNAKPKPLALYIFSKDKKMINYILNYTQSGDVSINDVVMHVANINLPFGGINNSGIGKSHGHHGFMAFTHERSYFKQAKFSTVSMLYPPFKKSTKSIIEKLIKYF